MNELTTIPQLKTEIQFYERQTATGMLEIGKRLIQIKEQLPHGEFMPWVEKELSYTDRTARNFMQCYAEYGNRQSISDLNSTQMIARLVYQDIYRSLKRNFGIATYRRLKVKYFDDAMELVRNHKSTETLSSRILEKLGEVN